MTYYQNPIEVHPVFAPKATGYISAFLACEKLRQCHGIDLSVATMRALMMVASRGFPARIDR
jgi:hypothetical protein